MVPPDRSMPSLSFSRGGHIAIRPKSVVIPISAILGPNFFMIVPCGPTTVRRSVGEAGGRLIRSRLPGPSLGPGSDVVSPAWARRPGPSNGLGRLLRGLEHPDDAG